MARQLPSGEGDEQDDSWVLPAAPGVRLPWQLRVEMGHAVGPLRLDLHFTLLHPWTVLFAPSGAGKTTVLRVIAGLERPERGRIAFERAGRSDVLTDTARGIFVPPYQRGVRLVSQRAALFSHRTVRGNVLYGFEHLARGRSEDRPLASWIEEILTLCRIAHLAHKRPDQLSGGERQRVALARALGAGRGRLLLLDEPFTGLDAAMREELIADLRVWLARRAVPVLMVTHDLSEVFSADAEVLRMEAGKIVATGRADVVLATERASLLRRLGSLS